MRSSLPFILRFRPHLPTTRAAATWAGLAGGGGGGGGISRVASSLVRLFPGEISFSGTAWVWVSLVHQAFSLLVPLRILTSDNYVWVFVWREKSLWYNLVCVSYTVVTPLANVIGVCVLYSSDSTGQCNWCACPIKW